MHGRLNLEHIHYHCIVIFTSIWLQLNDAEEVTRVVFQNQLSLFSKTGNITIELCHYFIKCMIWETVLIPNGNSQNDLVKYLRSKEPQGWRMTGALVKGFLFVVALIDLLACH